MLNIWKNLENSLYKHRLCHVVKLPFSSTQYIEFIHNLETILWSRRIKTKQGRRCVNPFFHSSLLSRIRSETVVGKTDACWTAQRFSATGCKWQALLSSLGPRDLEMSCSRQIYDSNRNWISAGLVVASFSESYRPNRPTPHSGGPFCCSLLLGAQDPIH